MTQFATVGINDSAAANVNFLTSNINYSTGVATWLAAGASFDASRALTFSLALPTSKSTRSRIKVKVMIPIMDVTNALLKKDELLFTGEFVVPKTSTLLQRQDLLAFAKNFLANALVTNAVQSNESVY